MGIKRLKKKGWLIIKGNLKGILKILIQNKLNINL